MNSLVIDVLVFFIPFLFALSLHEYAHGWMAYRLGDNTAMLMGRLTLNPIAHMDILGTLILPLALLLTGARIFFGWAKPVPVNPRNLQHPKNDMFWIALAGPLSNVLLAFIGLILMSVFLQVNTEFNPLSADDRGNPYFRLLDTFFMINVVLALFNMIPLHPLDGGKVLARFLPAGANYWLEKNQNILQIALIVLFISGAFSYLFQPIYMAWVYYMAMVAYI